MQNFYEQAYALQDYAPLVATGDHSFYPTLRNFIKTHSLDNKRCLEIGCGRGTFQDVVADYTGVDLSAAAGRYLHKPFYQCSAVALPFAGDSFDAVWSYAVLEHISQPESALKEMRRVLRPGGLLLVQPAWQCRPWVAEGYPVRPYSDFNWRGKLIKVSIPIRDSLAFRGVPLMARRLAHFLSYLANKRPTRFHYRQLKPNYTHYWMSDSDAVNSMDPFEAILWFISRGDHCLNYSNWRSQILVRTGALILRRHD